MTACSRPPRRSALCPGRHHAFQVGARWSHPVGGQTTARYSSGYLFFVNGDTLMGQLFDSERLELSGQPFLVEDGIGRSSVGSGAYALSDTGTLAYAGMPS